MGSRRRSGLTSTAFFTPAPSPHQPSASRLSLVSLGDERGSRAGIEAPDRERLLSPQTQPEGAAPSWLTDALRRIEDDGRLDSAADRLSTVADTVVSSPERRDALRGVWFGHALHPMLTDFPLGSWMSASLLDLVGGRPARSASKRLIGFGLLVAAPTVAAGLAEWQATSGGARRVGVVHAGVNATATLLYGSSWVARSRGRHAMGVLLGVGGGLTATLGGYFGGHLSLVRKVGTAPALTDTFAIPPPG